MKRLNKTTSLIIICFFALMHLKLIGQGAKLSGLVTDCKTKRAIPNTTIKLVSSTGINVEVLSDSLGFYYFNDSVIKPNISYIVSTISPIAEKQKTNKQSKCPYSPCYSDLEYLNSSDKVKFKTNDSLEYKNYKYDFCLVEMLKCGWSLPEIYFIKNSTNFNVGKINNSFDLYHNYSADTSFDCIVDFMLCNPRFVIEISGHADKKEKKVKHLSEMRSKKIYEMLIERGIEKERLRYKSYGSNMPVEEKDEIGNVVNHLKGTINQRVSIILLSRDYKLNSHKKISDLSEEDD